MGVWGEVFGRRKELSTSWLTSDCLQPSRLLYVLARLSSFPRGREEATPKSAAGCQTRAKVSIAAGSWNRLHAAAAFTFIARGTHLLCRVTLVVTELLYGYPAAFDGFLTDFRHRLMTQFSGQCG